MNQNIQKIKEEINEYSFNYFDNTLYADEIRNLEKERENLREKLEKL